MGRKGGGGGEHGHGKSEHKGAANSKSANHNTAKQSAPDVVERLDAKLDRVSTLQWPQQREQIQFEVFVFVFLMVHVMVQNLNIYQLVRQSPSYAALASCLKLLSLEPQLAFARSCCATLAFPGMLYCRTIVRTQFSTAQLPATD